MSSACRLLNLTEVSSELGTAKSQLFSNFSQFCCLMATLNTSVNYENILSNFTQKNKKLKSNKKHWQLGSFPIWDAYFKFWKIMIWKIFPETKKENHFHSLPNLKERNLLYFLKICKISFPVWACFGADQLILCMVRTDGEISSPRWEICGDVKRLNCLGDKSVNLAPLPISQ